MRHLYIATLSGAYYYSLYMVVRAVERSSCAKLRCRGSSADESESLFGK